MNLLGLDSSTAASSACVLRGDGAVFEHQPDRVDPGGRAHSQELLPAAARVLENSGLDWTELDAIGVGVGPGGFTGLRIGIATARALGGGLGIELRPVSSLAALAQGIAESQPASLQGSPRLPLIDAGRGEVFAALYVDRDELWPAFAARPEELAKRVRDAGMSPLAAGDGAIRFREMLESAGIRIEPDASRAHAVRARHICRLAGRAPASPPEAVLPDYLRSPDAKPRSK